MLLYQGLYSRGYALSVIQAKMKIGKLLIIVLVFLVMATLANSFFTNQDQWTGPRRTGEHNESDAVLIADTYQQVNKYPVYEIPDLSYLSGDISPIYDFEEFNGVMYAAGNYLYKFEGENWQTVSTYYGGYSLETYKDKLYIGADGGRLFSYDGTTFATLNLEVRNLYDMAVFRNKLFISGYSGIAYGAIYSYDGTALTKVNGNATAAITPLGKTIYAGTRNGSVLNSTDGTTWSVLYTFSNTSVQPLTVYNGKLYVVTESRLFRWDGSDMVLNKSLADTPQSMLEYNGKLYITTSNGDLYIYDDYTNELSSETMAQELYGIGTYKGKLYIGTGTGDNASIYSYQKKPKQEVTISSYIFKEYTTTIIGNATDESSISFNSLLEHLIIQPNTSTVNWRFKLVDPDGYTIYDGTDIDQTGRMGLIVDLPLIGIINTSIQNVTEDATFNVKIVYT